jgi:hypothetical protein
MSKYSFFLVKQALLTIKSKSNKKGSTLTTPYRLKKHRNKKNVQDYS